VRIVTPGGTWTEGFDLGDLTAAGENVGFACYAYREGQVAPAAIDQNPAPDRRAGNYTVTLYVPAEWLPGDTVQVLVETEWEHAGKISLWLPSFTLVGPKFAAILGS
jgi:hypothetical protein